MITSRNKQKSVIHDLNKFSFLLNLPDELLLNILSRLPLKDILFIFLPRRGFKC